MAQSHSNADGECLKFHGESHGDRVQLSEDRQTAWRPLSYSDHCPVMADSPMTRNMLYEVRIDEVGRQGVDTHLGLVLRGPEFLLTKHFMEHDVFTLYLTPDAVWTFGAREYRQRAWLRNLRPGSRVGLLLDSDRSLWGYLDGGRQDRVAVHVPTPCFFMLDLYGRCAQITALPVRHIPFSEDHSS